MKVFLDVGAHKGQTARIVTSSRYNFDRIICFEPALECLPFIESIGDNRIEINPFGLWKETIKKTLYGAGDVGASIFVDKFGLQYDKSVEIQLVKASDWIRNNINPDDVAIMKLNCEGSEVDIIDDLIDSRQIFRMYNIKIDFDVCKIPSMRKREFEVRRKLVKMGVENVCFNYSFNINNDFELNVNNWLNQIGAHEPLNLAALREKYQSALRKLSRQHRRFGRIREYCDYQFDGSYVYEKLKMIIRRVKNFFKTLKIFQY